MILKIKNKFRSWGKSILMAMLLLATVQLSAQSISGPGSATAFNPTTYTVSCSCAVSWSLSSDAGVVVSSTSSSAVIEFRANGFHLITADLGPGLNDATYFVNVTGGVEEALTAQEVYHVKEPSISAFNSATSNPDPADVLKTTTYEDGLGRVHQVVTRQGTPGLKDFVTTVDYDAFGRNSKNYLPFESADTDGSYKPVPEDERGSFYTSQYGTTDDDFAFSEITHEASPFNRVTKEEAPGQSWVGSNRGISYSYRFNTAGENVARWEGTQRMGTYAANQLYVTESTDENGHKLIEYTDAFGQVILSKRQEALSPGANHSDWLCTYYVYDDLLRLTHVIPPKAVRKIEANGWSVSTTVRDELLFKYTYDGLGRIITKEVPGANAEEYVYDKLDRPVLMRTSVQASESKWSFIMYDQLGRQAMGGTYNGSTNRVTLQDEVDGALFNFFEVYRENPGGYSLSHDYYYKPMVGLSGFNPETVMYYDDYSYTSSLSKSFNATYNANMSGGTHGITPASTDEVLGKLTGSKVKILGELTWKESVFLYDEKNRPIQIRSKNQKGGEDILTYKYDFSGKQLFTYMHHKNPDAYYYTNVRSMTRSTYDHADRLIRLEMRQDWPSSGAWQTIGEYTYDAIGQKIRKDLGGNTQQVDLSYNIRGWLNSINDPGLLGSDYFAMELKYDNSPTSSRRQYNGNVSDIEWRSTGDPDLKRYEYSYDRLNRLTQAYYNNLNDNVRDNDYTVNNLSYDANGNIKTLRRFGEVMGLEREIDNLVYTYMNSDNSNKLQAVSDDPSQAFTIGDFKDVTGTTDYTYDNNGNMLRDTNKGVSTNIVYNRINLPEVVNFGGGKTITYKYDASGAKVQKIINDNGDQRVLDYIGGFVYEDDQLSYFPHAEGRVRRSGTLLVYDYMLKDHLGNSRVTFTTEPSPTMVYKATMETDNHTRGYNLEAYEEQFFYNMDASRTAILGSNYSNTFEDGCGPCDEGALTNSSNRIGPAIILDVMPGDNLNLEVFAKANTTSNNSAVGQSTLVNALVNAFVPSGLSSELGSRTQSVFNTPSVYNAMKGGTPSGSNPRAYLNYVVFDQHFSVLASGSDPVKSTSFHKLSHSNVSISQKGYIYVWVSNENNQNVSVYFDDLKVSHTKSNILQEDHYYPFGMTMHGLSSAASLIKKNNYLFNDGTEFTEDFGWQMYDTRFRNYDPQLGRFVQIDPLADRFTSWNPYQFAYNDPLTWNDPMGLQNQDGSGDGESAWVTLSDVMKWVWENTPEGGSATFNFAKFNKWGGDEVDREFTSGGVNIFYEGEWLIERTSVTQPKLDKWGNILDQTSKAISITSNAWGTFETFGPTKPKTFINGNGKVKPIRKPNGKYYSRAARTYEAKVATRIKGVSMTLAVVGTVIDGIGVYNFYFSENPEAFKVHPAKAGVNAAVTAIGLWGGPPGWAVAGGYFLIEATVGWENTAELMQWMDEPHMRITGRSLWARPGIF